VGDGTIYLRPEAEGVAALDRERTKRSGVWAEVRIVWDGDRVRIACGGEAEDSPAWLVPAMLEAIEIIAEDARDREEEGGAGDGGGAPEGVLLELRPCGPEGEQG